MNDLKNKALRPEPDEATLAEIAALNDDQCATLEDVLAAHPTLSHKKALQAAKGSWALMRSRGQPRRGDQSLEADRK
jgi:hypothetical protein